MPKHFSKLMYTRIEILLILMEEIQKTTAATWECRLEHESLELEKCFPYFEMCVEAEIRSSCLSK